MEGRRFSINILIDSLESSVSTLSEAIVFSPAKSDGKNSEKIGFALKKF